MSKVKLFFCVNLIVLLLIDGLLTEPPSETTLFRDVTLYATVFKDMDVLIEADPSMKDLYYHWLKSRGAFDFVQDIVDYNIEHGVSIRYKFCGKRANMKVRYLGYHNFHKVINFIK